MTNQFAVLETGNKVWCHRPCRIEHVGGYATQVTIQNSPGNIRNDYRMRFRNIPGNAVLDPKDILDSETDADVEVARRNALRSHG